MIIDVMLINNTWDFIISIGNEVLWSGRGFLTEKSAYDAAKIAENHLNDGRTMRDVLYSDFQIRR